ncbi:YjgP/YjgQ family permease [Oceanispirochaeta crateris]|uniref:YjgP/YjgQ family permease n=1 Tax=Oceanispirochaeta crateris TaxID=2518645 RepID=A0A5C1QHM6_9SPIO|nr:LptF/LptG family permease [Oceanispirochaeta crateris]QEN07645.1 YjgP/YjgQ family permease [Oceanispirochaeta crateris]
MKTILKRPRSYQTLYLYIAKEFFLSFFVSFLFFFFIFFINQLLLLAEDILSKQVPFSYVMKLIFYSLPSIIAISFPFATLVGTLMTYGRFSSDNEILAMKCSGITYNRIFLPVLLIGILFSFLSFFVNDYLLPVGTINFTRLYREMIFRNPEVELESYSIKYFQDSIIITGQVEGKDIDNLIIIEKDKEANRRIILADEARINDSFEDAGVLSFELDRILDHKSEKRNRGEFLYSEAEGMVYNILLKDITSSIRNPGPREMSSPDVYRTIKEKEVRFNEKVNQRRMKSLALMGNLYGDWLLMNQQSNPREVMSYPVKLENTRQQYQDSLAAEVQDRSLQIWKLEFHQKFSIPFSCLPFVLLAFPLGLYTKRSGKSVGFGIGLFITILYWGMLVAGRTLGIRTFYPPALTMWLPNILIFSTGFILYLFRIKK